ncbi:low molecular weight protein-tyrosine-phosphatase [Streptomyces sp. NPDC058202]|uniref:low molecular weight protein-tyrosine-phosphatase n=1 Tax=Streptomyces sp. NPDC058202 TaxID=3346380 RepID=UPI0036ECBFF5
MRRILTVCLGNICRSPYAAAVLTRSANASVAVRSAGLSDTWTGAPAHERMREIAAARSYDLTAHRAAAVDWDLLAWADVVLAMDTAVLARLRERAATDTITLGKLTLYLTNRDVPDPYGQDDSAFTACADIIERGAHRHLN